MPAGLVRQVEGKRGAARELGRSGGASREAGDGATTVPGVRKIALPAGDRTF